MGQLYDRALTLTVNGQTIAELAGQPDQALRVRFKIQQQTVEAPNRAQIIVSNMESSAAGALLQEHLSVQLSAGYLDNSGMLFQGTTTQVIKGRESVTDTTLQIYAGDGETAYNHGVISKALPKGSTPMDHFNTLADALSAFGVTKGYAPSDILSSPQYPRGVSFAGMVRDHMRTLALSNGCTWSIQNGALQMVPASGAVPGAPIVLNSGTGLIGMPTQTMEGIMVRCLINPSINLQDGNLIQLNNADIQQQVLGQGLNMEVQKSLVPALSADGIYRALQIETTGDTRGRDWYMDLSCLNRGLSGFTPQSRLFNLAPEEAAAAQAQNQQIQTNLGKN